MMKKLVVTVLLAAMLLAMVPAMSLTASAADVDGMWTTYRFANEYPQPDDDPDEEKVYKPEAGYAYTSEGFQVVPADYKDTTPTLSVMTTDKQSVKDGIYLQFRVDDYAYDGGTGADQWIAPSLTTEPKASPGSTQFGGGWLALIRGGSDGNCVLYPCLTNPATEDFGGTFGDVGNTTCKVPLDENGRAIHTLEITWDGSAYEMKLNGAVLPGSEKTTELLEKLDANGEFYVGINMMSTVKGGAASLTVLKYGTSAADATVPVGTDSKEPEENEITIAEIADPSTVEVGKPAILWTPETVNVKGGNNCTFTVLGDNTWRVTATDSGVFFGFSPKRSWSYDAADFPVFGIMLRNIWVDGGTLWYAAGEVMSSNNSYTQPFSIYDGEFYGADEEYVFVPVDLTDLWEGRINQIRLDFSMSDPENREFDICFAGMFRSEDEAYAYANTWLSTNTEVETKDPNATEEETDAPTEAPTDEVTEAPTDAPQQGGDATEAPTEAPTDEPKSGCGSVIGFSAVAILAAAAAAVALKKD